MLAMLMGNVRGGGGGGGGGGATFSTYLSSARAQ